MKIKQISNNHIEVTVTEGDLLLFDMDMESLTSNSPNLRTFLFSILERVKDKTGIDVKSGQVFIEARKDENSIVFTIKRMGLTKEEKRKKYKNARPVIKPSVMRIHIYAFKKFADMSAALGYLDEDILLCASLYSFEDEYYCIFKCDCKFEKYDSVLSEFCIEKMQSGVIDAALCEYGKCIAVGEDVISLIRGIKEYGL